MRRFLFTALFAWLGTSLAAQPQREPDIQLREVSIEQGTRRVAVTLLIFSHRNFSIRIIDNAGVDNAARFPNLAKAMESSGCVAGCNGGFFNRHPFSPVGGMVSEGRPTSPFDPDSWMRGLLVMCGGHCILEAVEPFQNTPDITDLLQAGPWLVRAGQSESDSSRKQPARRTFICHNGGEIWAIGVSDSCTLLELATALKGPEISAIIDVQEAMNLDGGPSSGLWLKQSPENFYLPEKWTVRNFIGIALRSTP